MAKSMSKAKMSESHKGKKQSKEHIKSAVEGRKRLIESRGFFHSDEVKKRMSLAKKGRKLTEAHKEALRKAKRKKKMEQLAFL